MIAAISLDNLRKKVPSIFTAEGASRTSEKYTHISTARVVEGLMGEGFMPTWATQCRSRLQAKLAYTKHMLRFRHVDARPTASGLFPEIVLLTSSPP